MVYVEDVDARVAQAVAAGAKLTRPIANQFYGDRTGGIDDPFGYHWYIATHVEDVRPTVSKKRAAKAMEEHGSDCAGHPRPLPPHEKGRPVMLRIP